MSDALADPDLAALRAIAENPLIAPSKRVEARKVLREYREQQREAMTSKQLAQRIRDKLRRGFPLGWREAGIARELGLLGGGED